MKVLATLRQYKRHIVIGFASALVLSAIFLYKIAGLIPGLSRDEQGTARTTFGWHGMYHNSFYVALSLLRSIIAIVFAHHSPLTIRLGNVLLGMGTIFIMYAVVRLWYGTQTAIFTSILFGLSAWTLHVTRLASNDVMYLLAVPILLLTHIALRKYYKKPVLYIASIVMLMLLLFIPGAIYFVLLTAVVQRKFIRAGWKNLHRIHKGSVIILPAALLTLLGHQLLQNGALKLWLGLPTHVAPLGLLAKQIVAVPVHLFIRGPQYPQLWLGRAPILDIFSLAMSLIGIYFLARHFTAFRSKLIMSYFVIGMLLVGINGPVGLSLLVPLLYVLIATGLAYMSHTWLRTFPRNPLARRFGIGLLCVVITLSCIYNLREYFVAWPHNAMTRATFIYHL